MIKDERDNSTLNGFIQKISTLFDKAIEIISNSWERGIKKKIQRAHEEVY